MSKFGIFFNGRDIVLPGVYARVRAEGMTPERGVPSRALAILAPAQGGEVGGVTRITRFSEIREKLVGGVGAKLAEVAMGPSGEVGGATDIYFVRVNQATPATLDLGDVVLEAKVAGRVGNAVRALRIANGDAYDLQVEDTYRGLAEAYKGLGPVLELTYEGTNASPSAAVTDNAGVKTLTLTGDATATFDSDQLDTLEKLVDAINNTSEWSARLVGPLVGVRTEDLPAQTVTLAGTPLVGTVSLQGKAYEYALADSAIVKATAQAAAPSATSSWQFLSGGSEGPAPTVQDWLNALSLIESVEVYGVVLGTGDLAVLAAARQHVLDMSDTKARRERQLFVGPDLQSSKTALKDALKEMARTIGGARVVVAGFEPEMISTATGKVERLAAYYFAAMAAGMKAGNRPEMPLTNKAIAVYGGTKWSTAELEELLEAGVMPAHYDAPNERWVITQGITSYTRDANVIYRKIAGMDIADWLNKKIRKRLARFVGQVGDALTVKQILNAVVGMLQEEVRGPNNPDGVLTPGVDPATGAPTPAFRNVEAVMDGFDLVGIRYEAHPVGEIAYVVATANLTPVKIVASA